MSKNGTQVKPAQCEHIIERIIYSREFQLRKETYGTYSLVKICLKIRTKFLITIRRYDFTRSYSNIYDYIKYRSRNYITHVCFNIVKIDHTKENDE